MACLDQEQDICSLRIGVHQERMDISVLGYTFRKLGNLGYFFIFLFQIPLHFFPLYFPGIGETASESRKRNGVEEGGK